MRCTIPNWCSNGLTVEGPAEQVHKFYSDNSTADKPLSFEALVPTPKSDKGEPFEDWYDWRIENWGTKWDLSDDLSYEEQGDYIHYTFDTAWSPPAAWVAAVSAKYPDLLFTLIYEEGGMCFAGEFVAKGGEVTTDNSWDVEWDEETHELVPVKG